MRGAPIRQSSRRYWFRLIDPEPVEDVASFKHFDGDAGWLSVLSSSTVALISRFGSTSNVIEAAANVGAGDENDGWLLLHAVIRDFPIPLELRESVREAVMNVDTIYATSTRLRRDRGWMEETGCSIMPSVNHPQNPTERMVLPAGIRSNRNSPISQFRSSSLPIHYSGFDFAIYRKHEAKRHFSQENAASHEFKMTTLESKPL